MFFVFAYDNYTRHVKVHVYLYWIGVGTVMRGVEGIMRHLQAAHYSPPPASPSQRVHITSTTLPMLIIYAKLLFPSRARVKGTHTTHPYFFSPRVCNLCIALEFIKQLDSTCPFILAVLFGHCSCNGDHLFVDNIS